MCPGVSAPAARRLLSVFCGRRPLRVRRHSIEQLQGGTMLDTRDRAASVNARPPQSSGMTASRDSHTAASRARKNAQPAGSLENFLRDTGFDPNDPAALGDVLRALVEHGYDRAPFV